MYAIVEIAGKQFRIEKDKTIKVPLLHEEAGKKVTFDRVLFFEDDKGKTQIGQPLVKDIKVTASVVEHGREKKIIVFKKKRRKGYQKKNGHRQHYTLIKIENIGKARASRSKAKAAAPKENSAAAEGKEA